MRYEWDPAKRAWTLRERGIDFVDAIRIFDGAVLQFSRWPQSYPERRVVAIGLIEQIELTLVYTPKASDLRRIISARRAKRKEHRFYAEAFEVA